MVQQQAIFVRTTANPSIVSNAVIGYCDLKDALNDGWVVIRADTLSYNGDQQPTGIIYILEKFATKGR